VVFRYCHPLICQSVLLHIAFISPFQSLGACVATFAPPSSRYAYNQANHASWSVPIRRGMGHSSIQKCMLITPWDAKSLDLCT